LRATPGAGGDVLAGLLLDVELDPLAAVGVDGAGDELVLARLRRRNRSPGWKMTPGDRTNLDDPLGAVDDERALLGHHGEVAHEDVCSLISPVFWLTNRARTKIGAEGHVLLLHSSTVNFGGGRRSRRSGRTRARATGSR
jgi:hypothetical protein